MAKTLPIHPDVRALGKQFCEAMGLDPSLVTRLEIVIARGDAVTVRATSYLTEDAARGMSIALQRFRLVPVDEDAGA